MTITELAQKFCLKLSELGYSTRYVRNVAAILAQIINLHSVLKSDTLNLSAIKKYIRTSKQQSSNDRMMQHCVKLQILTAEKLIEFEKTGSITDFEFNAPLTYLNPYYNEIVEKYVSEVAETPNQLKSRAWAPKRFSSWLLAQSIFNLINVEVTHIREYLVEEIKYLKSKTIPSLRVEMRKFCRWAYENGLMTNDFELVFDFRIAVERKIHPAALPEEVALVLDSIDRSTTEGKRNYALVMLGVVTGLRGSDVARLKLNDIDWRAGEIKISQYKTKKPLALPLTEDVGKSIEDYIRKARPKCDNDYIFVSLTPPHPPLTSGRSPGMIYINYRKKLGLDSQGFYSLRRAVGKSLVTTGTDVATAAQVLGHVGITNVKGYIALDTVHLKDCALDFSNITPKGWCV